MSDHSIEPTPSESVSAKVTSSYLPWETIRAVLFDFDGVLMQSIEDHHRSWNEAFTKYSVTIGWEEFCLLEGQNLYTIARQLCRQYGVAESEADAIASRKNEIYKTTAAMKLYPFTNEIITLVEKKKMRKGLVTGALRDRFEASVGPVFTGRFDTIVTADEVRHTKPHPEPYLKAASALAIAPERCLVIENAPLGIASARSAGMSCIALTTTLPEKLLKDADRVLPDLQTLYGLFDEHFTEHG